jgi:hypothetical protein
MEMSGVVIYWSTSMTSLSKMRSACLAVDPALDKWIPETNTPYASLREALGHVFPGMLVRKLKVEGFAVVDEKRGDVANDYGAVASAWITDDDGNFETSAMTPEQQVALRNAYRVQRDVLQPGDVGVFLSRVISDHLDGTMLRPRSGGVYWLPQERADKWQAIADAVESAGKSTVYCLRHHMDEAAIRAVRDAIVYEVTSEAERINEQILSGKLGDRALASREKDAQQLIGKVQRYESLLDIGLDGVRKALGEVKDAAAAAAILATAGDAEPTIFGASE